MKGMLEHKNGEALAPVCPDRPAAPTTRGRLARALCSLAAAAAAVMWLAACGQAPQSPVAVGLNAWVGYDPLVLARDRDLLDGERVQVVELASGTDVQRALRNGLLEGAALTLDETLRLHEAGMDLRIVAVFDTSHGADVVVAQPGIEGVLALRDAYVAVEDGSTGAVLLERMLQRAGLSRSDVKVVNMEATMHLAALREGRVAAAVTYAPLSGPLIAAGYRPLFSSREIPGEIVDVLVLRAEVLRARPEAVDALLSGWAAGLRELGRDAQGATDALARGADLSPDQYREVLEGLRFVDLPESLRLLQGPSEAMQRSTRAVGDALRSMGRLQREPALRELIDVQPLQRVLDTRVEGVP